MPELAVAAPEYIAEPGLQLALDLQHAGALTLVSLELEDEIPLDQYESLGTFFGTLKRAASWWLGDWLIFGEATYGERVSQAMEATGLAQETLAYYRSVCEKVPRSRRLPQLGFGHHALVRNLAPRQQERWLQKALKNDWPEATLKSEIAEWERKQKGEQQTLDTGDDRAAPKRVDKDGVVEVGWAILRDAREIDDGYVAIPTETFTRLKAMLGAE